MVRLLNGTIKYSYTKDGTTYKTLPTNAGTYTIKASVEATGNYAEANSTNELTLTISKSIPTIAFVSGYTLDKTYDGQTIATPAAEDAVVVTGAGYDDVTFQWSATPQNADTYTLTATIPETTNTAKAEATLSVTISPKTVSNPTIELSPAAFEYDGSEKEPAVTVKDGETVIPASEYTVEYSGNVNVGTDATVTITDKDGGNYTVNGY